MKYSTFVLVIACLSVSACATEPTRSLEFERITTKERYLELVADRKLAMKGNNFTSSSLSDGTMTGSAGDRKLSGTWTWDDGYFCREGTFGSKALDYDCQMMEVSGNILRITRNKGKGEVVTLQIK